MGEPFVSHISKRVTGFVGAFAEAEVIFRSRAEEDVALIFAGVSASDLIPGRLDPLQQPVVELLPDCTVFGDAS